VTGTTGVKQTGQPARRNARQLPNTASALPLIALLGFASLGVACGLMVFRKRATATAV
jgi:LPXTG-motif cell wall-anchored protein